MSNFGTTDFNLEIAKGNIEGHTAVHKFGRAIVTTTLLPITIGNIYQMPQASAATTLRIKAGGNAADTAAGAGAREITIEGLDETGALVTETVATAGASASSVTTATFMRLFGFWVSASGVYSPAASTSHAGSIVVENGSGGTDWGTIDATDFKTGQSEIGCYTVPLGKTAFMTSFFISPATTKVLTLLGLSRASILDSAAPYEAWREFFRIGDAAHLSNVAPETPVRFEELTDIVFQAAVGATTGEVDIDFEIVLIDNEYVT